MRKGAKRGRRRRLPDFWAKPQGNAQRAAEGWGYVAGPRLGGPKLIHTIFGGIGKDSCRGGPPMAQMTAVLVSRPSAPFEVVTREVPAPGSSGETLPLRPLDTSGRSCEPVKATLRQQCESRVEESNGTKTFNRFHCND